MDEKRRKELEEAAVLLRQLNGNREQILEIDYLLGRTPYETKIEDRKYRYIDLAKIDDSQSFTPISMNISNFFNPLNETDYEGEAERQDSFDDSHFHNEESSSINDESKNYIHDVVDRKGYNNLTFDDIKEIERKPYYERSYLEQNALDRYYRNNKNDKKRTSNFEIESNDRNTHTDNIVRNYGLDYSFDDVREIENKRWYSRTDEEVEILNNYYDTGNDKYEYDHQYGNTYCNDCGESERYCKCCSTCGEHPCECCSTCGESERYCKCCSTCGEHPCECCSTCGESERYCKCCSACGEYPCECCSNCREPSRYCKCCSTCDDYPCKCCSNCREYPCECCSTCGESRCHCCSSCGDYPCSCCSTCGYSYCRCCSRCEEYPCSCDNN